MVDLPGGEGANEGFWRFQIRDKYGKWVEMGGGVTFDTMHPNFGRLKGNGTFTGGSRPGFALIKVKDVDGIKDGSYEVPSADFEAVKAIIPKDSPDLIEAKRLDAADGVLINAPTEPKELKDSITGDEALQKIYGGMGLHAKKSGRFAVGRGPADVKAAAKETYKTVYEKLRVEYPELMGEYPDYESYWARASNGLAAGFMTRWEDSADNINPLTKASNRIYAREVLGLKEDGLIEFYRNAVNHMSTKEWSAAGYASLDRRMAWDYNAYLSKYADSGLQPNDGRYIIKAKPEELSGLIGFSQIPDEYGVVIGLDVVSQEGRAERVGDLEMQKVSPWSNDIEEFDRSGGASPFRRVSPASQFEVFATDNPVPSDDYAGFYESFDLDKDSRPIPTKWDEMFGAGSFDALNGQYPSYKTLQSYFVDAGGGKVGLDMMALDQLSSRFSVDPQPNDEYDKTLKMLSVIQELSGKAFMVHRGHRGDDPRVIEAKKLDAADGVVAKPAAPAVKAPERELTTQELETLLRFTDSGYAPISNKLRRGMEVSPQVEADIETLVNLIDSSKATEDRIIYRGTFTDDETWADQLNTLEIGDVIVDPGIGSASPDIKVAENFATMNIGSTPKARAMFTLNVPKGSAAFDIPRKAHSYISETETLLPPGTSIKVTGIEKRDGVRYVTADVVDSTQYLETPAETSEKSGIKNLTGFTQIGRQKGSNPGGLYQDPTTGEKFYVKFEDAIRVDNEVLASKLYEKTGINAIKVEKGSMDGKTISYSKWEDGTSADLLDRLQNDPDMAQKLKEGFAVDAWLGNWDVVGLVYDNLIFDAEGNDLRVDPGGALLYRAQGARKGDAFGDVVGELETFQEGGKTTSRIYGNMTQLDRVMSARKLLDISDADIDEMVDATISDAADSELLKTRLKNRRSYILTTYGLDGKAPAKADILGKIGSWAARSALVEGIGESSILDDSLAGTFFTYDGLTSPVSSMDAEMFTRDQRVAIKGYTGTDYKYINTLLRTGEATDSLRVHLEKEIADIDSAIDENGVLEEPARVFRGIIGYAPGTSGFNGTDWSEVMKNLKIGDVFTDDAYMSTTNNPSIAYEDFGAGSGYSESTDTKYKLSSQSLTSSSATVFFSIDLPAGSKALGIPDEFSTSNHEQEVLLPRGTKLEVRAIRRVKQRRFDAEVYNYFVDVEAIPQDEVGVIDVVDKTAEQRKNEVN